MSDVQTTVFALSAGSVDDFCAAAYNLRYEMQPRRVVKMLRGKNMMSTRALFNEFAAALQFPCYFGNNWNAFDECVADLEWMPGEGYVILIVNGSQVLSDEPEELATFCRIMRSVGKEWADDRGRPFQTILQCSEEEVEIFRRACGAPVDGVVRVTELKSFVYASQSTTPQG